MDKLSSLHKYPQSLLECIDPKTKRFDIGLFLLYRRRRWYDESFQDMLDMLDLLHDDNDADEEVNEDKEVARPQKRRRKEVQREQRIYRCPIDGQIKPLGPQNTSWYANYVECPDTTSDKFHRKFRRRFRMSFQSFQLHLQEVKGSTDHFGKWSSRDCTGKQSSPIELLLLATLRYLGRGWTFDDMEEQTLICEEVHRRFLHVYIQWASTYLYQKYVVLPRNNEELKQSSSEYELAGLPGCLGSQDATHIGMHRCQYRLRQYHNSYKLPMPTRTYNLTVNHRRRILSSTRGHPGRWNDKTLVLFDELSTGLRDGRMYNNMEFNLLELDRDTGRVKKVRYVGAWLLVDNGYLWWPTLIPPITSPSTWEEFRFSKWMESMRKDVECTFGILKCRFAVLKRGITLQGIDATDRIWLTCCALHNFLLEEDGLDVDWGGVQDANTMRGDERGQAGANPRAEGVQRDINLTDNDANTNPGGMEHEDNTHPMNVGRDRNTRGVGGTGHDANTEPRGAFYEGADPEAIADPMPLNLNLPPVKVWSLSRDQFRDRLVENFSIRWSRKEIVWPSRAGQLDSFPNIE